jgi:hypothetical protein
MVTNNSGWRGRLGTGAAAGSLPADLPLEARQRILAEVQRQPLIEVTVRLYGLDNGQAEVEVKPADVSVLTGTELAGLGGRGPARAAAYARLAATLQRELQAALARLGAG